MNAGTCRKSVTLMLLIAAAAGASSFFCLVPPFLSPATATAQPVPPPPPTARQEVTIPRLTVNGQAELEKPADQLRIRLGVVTENAEAETAMAENSERMQQVIEALADVGLTPDEYQTGRFQIQPIHSRPPRSPEPDWRPRIVAYRVTNSLNIKTQQLDKAGELLQAATEAGVNNIESVNFDLANPRVHRAEAITVAATNARFDAEALAQAMGVRLVRVLSVNLDHAFVQPMPYERLGMERAVAADVMVASPPIHPGDVTVRANVTVVYEIAPD